MAIQAWFSEQRELKLGFSKRTIAAITIVIVMLGILIAQLVQLQIIEHEKYITRADNNRLDSEPAVPARGRIYSRQGELLADNQITYQLSLIPDQIDNIIDTTLQLSQLVNLTVDDARRFNKQYALGGRYRASLLKASLTERELAQITARQHRMPGVKITRNLSRIYPQGSIAGHAVGYVAPIDKDDLKKIDPHQYRGTQYIGTTGVEYHYEQRLHGLVGRELIEVNAVRRKLGTVEYDAPVAGSDLYVTIDLALQRATKQAFLDLEDPLNGAAVAIEPSTGDILALVNHPNFDPNLFATGINIDDKIALEQDDNTPQFNRSVQGQYPPGSTIKPFVALAALHYDEILPKPEYCKGFIQVGSDSRRFRDWKRSGHGPVDLNLAMAQSCDVFFYEVSRRLGIDRMHAILTQFNLGRPTGVDLTGERRGLIPNTHWKRRVYGRRWVLGETLNAGIGQGYVKTTPLQLAHATATLANRGRVIAPRLVRAIAPAPPTPEDMTTASDAANETTGEPINESANASANNVREIQTLTPEIVRQIDIAPEHWQQVIDGMVAVVHGRRGTARGLSTDLDFIMAGKTGTAQVKSLAQQGDNYQHDLVELKHRDHALFVAFAPVDNPQIAVAVVVEHGGSGGKVAGPIAKTMLTHWLNANRSEIPLPAAAHINPAADAVDALPATGNTP